jgi:hypothetical protein
MRDYTQHFYTVDDMPFVFFNAQSHYFFNSPEECQAFIDSFAGSSPGGGTLTPVASAWFRWNKNLCNIFLNSSYVQNVGPNINQGEKRQNIYLESPRSFGVNSVDERTAAGAGAGQSAKKSDFSGANTLFQAFLALTGYAAALQAEGRTRDAGIVLYAIAQVNSQKWSITQAFQYLRDNNLG